MAVSVPIPVIFSPNVSLNLDPNNSLNLSKLKDPILPPENRLSTLCDNSVPVEEVAFVDALIAVSCKLYL